MTILKAHKSTAGTLDYNEKKVVENNAAIIGMKNIPGDDMLSIRSVFERLERRNIRTQNVSFQMAINPNENAPSEKYTDEEMVRLAEEVMERLGYGDQPFFIVRHNDIPREHYHVVSIRVNEKGRKIDDFKEEYRLQKIMMELKKEYHFEIGETEKKEETKIRRSINREARPVRFSRANGPVREQFKKAFDACINYKFSTAGQFSALMIDCGFRVEFHHIKGNDHLTFQGLDKQGKPSTKIVDTQDLCPDIIERLTTKLKDRTDYVKGARPELFRIKNNALYCAKIAKSENHFRAMMAKRGVGVHFAKTEEGKIFGVTFIDHNSKSVFKASDVDREISAKMFQELKDTGKWKESVGDSLKMGKFLVPTNTLGIGVFASQHDQMETFEAADLGYTPMQVNHTRSVFEELLRQGAGSSTSKSQGKDPKKKEKKKTKKASYL